MMQTTNSSYLYGVDTHHGLGNKTFFTYFAEFNRPWHGIVYVEATFLVTLFLISLAGNVVIIFKVIKDKRSRNITDYFVCNLALADVMYTLGGPFIAVVRITETWKLGEFICHILAFMECLSAFGMVWTMAAISIDRYICINLNMASSKRIRPRSVAIISVVIWIFVGALFIPVAVFFLVVDAKLGDSHVKICTLVWPYLDSLPIGRLYVWITFVLGFILPFTIIVANYTRIFKKFWLSSRAVANAQIREVRTGSMSQKTRILNRKNLKTVKMLVLLVILFILMWLPTFAMFLAITHDYDSNRMVLPSSAMILVILLGFINACINPFLYGLIHNRFQGGTSVCRYCCHSRPSMERACSRSKERIWTVRQET
ncbi:hypothetical protein ACJMK2_006360 [Sinanodonta woodiana]|uniref:G-protein coupled receptors family 1 profile domain-containing protein n=1 Tax=Sinanodonta woodiana TaxID=1069815 RepID=A0ABD3VWE9_SINWO